MAHLSLGVLGSLQVLIDDRPVTMFESDKVRALLAYLAVEADRPHRREFLVGLLWPDFTEETARHNLRQALFNLRLALGDHTINPPYLLTSRNTIQFNPASDFSLDFAQFNKIFYTCEEDRSRCIEDCPIRAARLEEIVRLYRGDFLEHFFLEDSSEFEEWALLQRESSHQHILEAYSYLANYYELHRDFEAARRHALRQLELDPWREEAHCQMMRALALDGQRSAALAQYETCRRVLAEELGVEPSANTRELVEQIRTGTLKTKDESPSPTPTVPIYNLPVSLTPFLGREQELIDLDRLISNPECRCLSLVGPGGIGKTRLALQAGEQNRADFTNGVVFIPLASVSSVGSAIPAIASAIHLHFYGPDDPRIQLLNHLCKKHMLLILDNVEQLLIEGSPQTNIVELVLDILQRAPGVKLLVTSREALNLQEEWIFEVRGLAFPETEQTEEPDEYAAVALFIQRAKRASLGHGFNKADLAAIAEICRLVEGMPLAIELAATWLRTLSPAEIAEEIEDSLDFLSTSLRDLPERHRSMRVVFDQTWHRLSAKEQQVLSYLSVFQGEFSRQAAEQVAGASLPVLSTLVNRTLLRRATAGRYHLHLLVRQYCTTHLKADPQAHAAAQQRHYDFFLALAETAKRELMGPNQLEWLGRLEQEQNNLLVALKWTVDNQAIELGLRLGGALWRFWWWRGHWREGLDWLERLLPRADESAATLPPGVLALASQGAGVLARSLGDYGQARLYYQRTLALRQQENNLRGVAAVLNSLGNMAMLEANYPEAESFFYQSRQLYAEVGDTRGLENSSNNLGIVAMYRGDFNQALAFHEENLALAQERCYPYQIAGALGNLGDVFRYLRMYEKAQTALMESLALLREINNKPSLATTLYSLGRLAIDKDDLPAAAGYFQQCLTIYRESQDPVAIADAIEGVAILAWKQKRSLACAELFGAAAGIRHKTGTAVPLSERDTQAQIQAEVIAAFGEQSFQDAWLRGEQMNMQEAITAALMLR